MEEQKRSKMTRQIQIHYLLTTSKIIGPNDIMNTFGITRRMLQRDLKDLRDCGLINVKYNRSSDNYVISGDAIFDTSAGDRRKQHLIRLYRIGTLIHQLAKVSSDDLQIYEHILEEYELSVQDSLKDPVNYPPEDVPDKPEPLDLPDIKAKYYELFPDSNERTRQRDFEEMNRAGFNIYYSRKHKAFIFEYDEYTGLAMKL